MQSHLDALMFKKAFLSGASALNENKALIDELNVFPVPDGDTGTNMTMTIMSAAYSVDALENPDIESLCEAIAKGSLKGARGNSGVILSQILRGMTGIIKKQDGIDTRVLALAFQKGSDTAFKAVMQPKEGTILTVIREVAECAAELAGTTEDIEEFFIKLTERAREALDSTPELLPVLKEAGVVDSGGMGLLTFLNGMLYGIQGKSTDIDWSAYATPPKQARSLSADGTEGIEFGYCTEMIIMLKDRLPVHKLKEFQEFLQNIGDSIVFVPDTDMIKLHVHTNDPGRVLSRALSLGELSNIKIDNMREEHRELIFSDTSSYRAGTVASDELTADSPEANKKEIGFLVVSAGEGFSEIFKELGADEIIEGGQTMNPSTGDIISRLSIINAENVFVFPNNKNIIMACKQAAELVKDKNVIVMSSTTVPQGIAAMMSYLGDASDVNAVRESMDAAIGRIHTYSLTYSVRDTELGGYSIEKNDIMVLGDKGIVAVEKDLYTAMTRLLDNELRDDLTYISVYRGSDVSEDDAERIAELLGNDERLADIELDLTYGGQPVYYYILSFE